MEEVEKEKEEIDEEENDEGIEQVEEPKVRGADTINIEVFT